MSVDYCLFRSPTDRDNPGSQLPAFGSQKDIIERLCAIPEFTLHKKSLEDDIPWATMTYIGKGEQGEDFGFDFELQGDPVDCISSSDISPRDFLPIIEAFSELAPFEIIDIDGEVVSLDDE
jgi:hypothetical protein